MIRKPWIDTLFRGTKVKKLVSYLRLEFNTEFIYQGMSFVYVQRYFLKCEITTIIVGNFEAVLSVSVTKAIDFTWNRVLG